MPERTQEFGKYGARGIKGSEAVARQLDKLVSYIASPVTSARGLAARLKYLTATGRRVQAARDAGLTVTDRTLGKWQSGMQKPNRANQERIDTAYREVRRQNVRRDLLRRLERDGRGTRVEIHPLNQSHVSGPRQRPLSLRTPNVRHWDRIVDAWADGDDEALDNAWIDEIAGDLGSDWGMYEYVTNVGFAA